ncbi:MAG TPA: HdeD family acid-resistance protein [Candidatus Methylacidiphilales bacterium]|nr:HdeD family acid-resistance protein [Candidatus Methylacidiphilales bacterium]
MSEELSPSAPHHHRPVWFLVLGIIYIVAGLLAVASPLLVTLFSVFFFGILLMIAGFAAIIHAFSVNGWEGFAVQLLAGVMAAVAGFLLVADATSGALVITLILASYFLVSGLFRLGFAISHKNLHHRGWLLFSGTISFLLGILVLAHLPSSALWVIGTFIGIDLIFYGFSLVGLFRLTR